MRLVRGFDGRVASNPKPSTLNPAPGRFKGLGFRVKVRSGYCRLNYRVIH